jgi:hypothetical protein
MCVSLMTFYRASPGLKMLRTPLLPIYGHITHTGILSILMRYSECSHVTKVCCVQDNCAFRIFGFKTLRQPDLSLLSAQLDDAVLAFECRPIASQGTGEKELALAQKASRSAEARVKDIKFRIEGAQGGNDTLVREESDLKKEYAASLQLVCVVHARVKHQCARAHDYPPSPMTASIFLLSLHPGSTLLDRRRASFSMVHVCWSFSGFSGYFRKSWRSSCGFHVSLTLT